MYKSSDCMFLLDESDSLAAYEELAGATTYPSTHDAAVAALGTIDHVHQVEAIHRKSVVSRVAPAALGTILYPWELHN